MKECDICGRAIHPGELFGATKSYVWEVATNIGQEDELCGLFLSFQCQEHIPGHILRAAKGITTITGAASLGVQEVK
jgi:hypothetical protein